MIIKSNSTAQLNTIGNVQITTRFCASDVTNPPNNAGYSPQDPWCQKFATGGNANAGGNSGSDAANNVNVQLKVAYRIPTNVTAPSSFTTTEPSGGSAFTFTQSASYASAIQALSPAGSGKQWVGYLSSVKNYTTAGGQYFTVAPEFTLQRAANGAPFQGPLNYRVVTGYRQVDEGTPGSTSARTVTCGTNAFALYNDGVDGPDSGTEGDMLGICIDDPSSSTLTTDLSQATRDLGVIAGSAASGQAGTQATVPFTMQFSGAACFCAWPMTATTNISGATATPAVTDYVPSADSTISNNVTVNVPAGTAPGTYNVTLSGTFDGQTRSKTNTLVVGENFGFGTAPDAPNLPGLTLNGQAQTKTAAMANFSVIDSPGSSDQGWNVTVVGNTAAGKSAVFKQYCPNASCGADPLGYVSGGFTLPADSLTLNTTGASWTGGTGSTPTFSCNAGCSVDRAATIKIASAANGGGTGMWSTSGFGASSLSLATASTVRALLANEQYRVDVVWTLSSGP